MKSISMKTLIIIFLIVASIGAYIKVTNASKMKLHLIPSLQIENTKEADFIPNDSEYLIYQSAIFKSMNYIDTYNGKGVKLALIDSGINKNHKDLIHANIESGYNYSTDNISDMVDRTGHGTFIAGIIAATRNNELGITGFTPEVSIVPLKCFDNELTTDIDSVVKCINKAIELEVDVINMSFTIDEYSEDLKNAIDRANQNDIIIVASAGNDLSNNEYYPAKFKNVISVNSIHLDPVGLVYSLSKISNSNKSVTVSAIGDDILSLNFIDTTAYRQSSGSSYATAIVSSLAIMIKQKNKSINGDKFIEILRNSSTDLGEQGYDNIYGYGLINIKKAIELSE